MKPIASFASGGMISLATDWMTSPDVYQWQHTTLLPYLTAYLTHVKLTIDRIGEVAMRRQVVRWCLSFESNREVVRASSIICAKARFDAKLEMCDMVPSPLYSSDLAPCDYFLFPQVKDHWSGTRFSADD
ncbi:hypothetical protein AVEN_268599-1 [Araneus ventricosus]|uniref:Uncharacterized protein n=1 Tax=Araneus ventricosus TaxID=182803 RepID=A0A4Y2H059_ARAVE|nr:hypothetical protein AVEN_268599-1 [Araneus ventricosus]